MEITYFAGDQIEMTEFYSRIKQTLEIRYRFFSFLSVLSQVEVVAITGLKVSSVYTQSTHDTVSALTIHTAPRRRMAMTCVGVVQYYIIFINTYDDNQMDLGTRMYVAHGANIQFSQMSFLSLNTSREWSNYIVFITRNVCIDINSSCREIVGKGMAMSILFRVLRNILRVSCDNSVKSDCIGV